MARKREIIFLNQYVYSIYIVLQFWSHLACAYCKHQFDCFKCVDFYLQIGNCIISSETLATCRVPRAPESLKVDLLKMEHKSEFSKYIRAICVFHLDNVQENVEITYYLDPVIHDLTGSGRVVRFKAKDRRLKITVCIFYIIF